MLSQDLIDDVITWAIESDLDTPSWLFSAAAVRSTVAELRSQLDAVISYATKANAHPLMLGLLEPIVEEFNVTNVGHLDQLLALGVEPTRITWLHPASTAATLSAVLDRGITRFVVDDVRGVELLRESGRDGLGVTLRLRPPDAGESERSVVRFGEHGIALRRVARRVVDAGIGIEALSFFVGAAGEMSRAEPFRRGIAELAALRDTLDGDGIHVPTVNIGGGFPGARQCFYSEHPDFFAHIRKHLAQYFPRDTRVICEPGRYLSEPSFTVLARVIVDRRVADRRIVSLDTSAYGGLFETSFIEHGGVNVDLGVRTRRGPVSTACVVGPVMDSFDVVKRHADLPPLAEGDLVVIPGTGAYAWGYTAPCEGLRQPRVVRIPAVLDARYDAEWHV
jgi:ornithine decarboxylase